MPEHCMVQVIDLEEKGWTALQDQVRALEKAWEVCGRADISQFVPSIDDPLYKRILVELIKVDQEYRLRIGMPRRLEEYLQAWPILRNDLAVVQELLEAECLTFGVLNRFPTREELRARFPEVCDRIQWEQIQASVETERAAIGLGTKLSVLVDGPAPMNCHTPSGTVLAKRFTVGQSFGHYQILGELGHGGMGTVYRAYHTVLDKEVALKIPNLDFASGEAAFERFVREARAVASVPPHPNICPIYDAGQIDGMYYLTMALIEGESLAEHLKKHRPEPQEAAELVYKLATALAVVHSRGIVHRDIKPHNVMLDKNNRPRLMDFGLARRNVSDRHLTVTGLPLGTIPYMSPEHLNGNATFLSDIYSLGVLLYETLTGQMPFEGPFGKLLVSIAQATPPKPHVFCPRVDSILEAICLKAMAKNPVDRYQSAEAMAEALQEYLLGTCSANVPSRQRNGLARICVGGGIVVFLFLCVIIYIKTDRGTTSVRITDPNAQITVTPDNVTVNSSGSTVSIDVANPTPTRTVSALGKPIVLQPSRWFETEASIGGICLSKNGTTLYAAYWEDDHKSRVQVFDITSGKVQRTIPFGNSHPHGGVALSADEQYLYTTNYYAPYMSRIDLRNNDTRTDLLVGGLPHNIWANMIGTTPNREKLVVALGCDGRTNDLDNDQISIVDIANGKFSLIGEVRLRDEPTTHQIGLSQDNRFAYVVTSPRKSPEAMLHEIALTPPYEITRSLSFHEGKLSGIAISPRHNFAFVSDSAQRKLWRVDLHAFTVASSVDLDGHAPGSLTITAEDEILAVITPESRKVFLLDLATCAVLGRIDGLRQNPTELCFSSDNQRLFVTHQGTTNSIAVIEMANIVEKNGVVFASNRAGESYQIYRLQNNGDVVRLTNNHATDRCPRWSPGGRKIAFISTAPGPPKIMIMDRQGKMVEILKNTDPVMSNGNMESPLDWSPDGSELVFIGGRSTAVRIVNASSGQVHTLVEGDIGRGCSHHLGLCWRKSDGAILLNSCHPASRDYHEIFQLDPRTLKVVPVTNDLEKSSHNVAPVSSPNGKRIAVLQQTNREPPKSLCLMRPDSTGLVRLVQSDETIAPAMRWTADGRYLLYSSGSTGRYHLYSVNIDNGKCFQLTNGNWEDIDPDIIGDVSFTP